MARLMVVDDEPDLMDALSIILSDLGHEILTAPTGQEALDALKASKDVLPHLIIADVLMPRLTGIELLEAVRADPELAHIPFLFISASVTPDLEAKVTLMDQTILLRKPFEVDELVSVINDILGGQ